jgi:hypothetical protein
MSEMRRQTSSHLDGFGQTPDRAVRNTQVQVPVEEVCIRTGV